ncbi:MAG TPA: BON domain-containing protein [Steroidobacteraceae bacterium]|jgi:hyperosmotically inducible protein
MSDKKVWGMISIMSLGLTVGAALADETNMKSDQPVTDSYITTKVKAELAKDSTTKARHIHVTTKDGNVILKGMVASDDEKQKAEQDASGVKGVTHVDNELTVKAEAQ